MIDCFRFDVVSNTQVTDQTICVIIYGILRFKWNSFHLHLKEEEKKYKRKKNQHEFRLSF